METNSFDCLRGHARSRMQQRGISPRALFCLLEYGREAHGHDGRVTIYFDKAARRRLQREAQGDALKRMSQFTRLYAVVAAMAAW